MRELIFRQPFLKLLVISKSYSHKSLVTPFTASRNHQILLGKHHFLGAILLAKAAGPVTPWHQDTPRADVEAPWQLGKGGWRYRWYPLIGWVDDRYMDKVDATKDALREANGKPSICSTCRTKNEATPCRGSNVGKAWKIFWAQLGFVSSNLPQWLGAGCRGRSRSMLRRALTVINSNYLTAAVRGLVVFRGLKCSYWLDILGSWSNHHSFTQAKMVSNIIGSVPVWDECRNSADGWRHTQIT